MVFNKIRVSALHSIMFACVILFLASCTMVSELSEESAQSGAVILSPTAAASIPGRIEAENYGAMSGIQTEACSEGTLDVGWIDSGDWMDYPVTIQQSGAYTADFRIASLNTTGKLDLIVGSTVLASISIPGTAGWQNWTTVKASVYLDASVSKIRLSANSGGFNINWFDLALDSASSSSTSAKSSKSTAVSSAQGASSSAMGGALKLECFNGSLGLQNNSINPKYRLINTGSTAVSLSQVKIRYFYTIDGDVPQTFWCDWSTAGSANVNGKFVKLTSPVTTADYYMETGFSASAGDLAAGANVEIQTRFAKNDWTMFNQGNDYSFNSTASAYVDWNKVSVVLNGAVVYGVEPGVSTSSSSSVSISSSISSKSSVINSSSSSVKSSSLSSIKVSSVSSSFSSSSTSSENLKQIPGKIEAESYNAMSGILTETCAEGTLDVGWVDTGDWLDYNVNVVSGGTYTVDYRLATQAATGKIDFKIGNTVLASTVVPNTGGWQVWTSVSATVTLTAGNNTIRLYASGSPWNLNYINIQKAASSSSVSSASSSSSSSTSGYTGFIRANGKKLTDANGKEFFIRAIGIGNWLLPEGYMWKFNTGNADRPRRIEKTILDLVGQTKADAFWKAFYDNYITEADVKKIAEIGFNTVRLALNSRIVMEDGTGMNFIPEGFQRIDNLITWCKKYGVYVVIDLHGAPGGQTGANIDDCVNDQPELFQNDFYWNKTITLWKEIASRYKNEPYVLAYDLLNEPLPTDRFASLTSKLEPFYKACTTAIRAIDTSHIITIEGANWAQDWSVFGTPFDSNLLYQFHKYWNATDQASIQTYVDFRNKYNVPIWCGETGENDNNWYRASFGLLESNNIGWAFWPWKKLDTTNDPYSIKTPNNWYMLQNFAASRTPIDPATADAILASFLENCKLANCTYVPDAVNAVFRR